MNSHRIFIGAALAILLGASPTLAQDELTVPDGVWVGEYTCKGQSRPLMVEFDTPDKPASVSFVTKKNKGPEKAAKFHANAEVVKNKKGHSVVVLKPRYWLKNPGNTKMLRLRGKITDETIEGKLKKKGCKKFTLQKLPCDTLPEACSEDALGMLHSLLGNGKEAKTPKEPKQAKVAKSPSSPGSNESEITAPPLRDAQFKTLLNQLKAEPFQKGQLVVIARWSSQYKMSSQQVATILKLQRFPSDQLDVLKALAASISDMENIAVVLDVMRFRKERQAAEQIILQRHKKYQAVPKPR